MITVLNPSNTDMKEQIKTPPWWEKCLNEEQRVKDTEKLELRC